MAVILTIDDEQSIRQSFRNFLEDYDYEVLEAENGRQGLEVFHRERPDLVMVDLCMPGFGGLEVLDELCRSAPDTPVIVVSGTGVLGDAVAALRKGAWDFLIKPIVDLSILLHTVEKSIERSRLIRENRDYQLNLEKKVEQRALELARAHSDLEKISTRLQGIVKSTYNISGNLSSENFAVSLLEEFRTSMGVSGGSFYQVEKEGLRLLHTLDPGHAPDTIAFPLREGSVLQRALKEVKPMLIEDLGNNKLEGSGWKGYGDQSVLVFPMPDQDGNITAILSLHDKKGAPFMSQDREIGNILATYSSEALHVVRISEALHISETRQRAVIEKNPIPMIITRGEHRIEYFNEKFYELFGYSQAEIPDDALWWAHAWPDEVYREQARSCWQAAFERAQASGAEADMGEWTVRCKNGLDRVVEMKLMPLGDIYVISMHDISERKLAETRIRDMNRHLEKRVKERTVELEAAHAELLESAHRVGMAAIATGTLHNIGNLLNSVNLSIEELDGLVRETKIRGLLKANEMIRANVDDLGNYFFSDPRGQLIPAYLMEAGEVIKKEYQLLGDEINFLSEKVDTMREVIRTQKRYAVVSERPKGIPIGPILEDALRLQAPSLTRQGVEVVKEFRGNPICVILKVKLLHVLNNLIENGIEAMEGNSAEGKPQRLTLLISEKADEGAQIRIIDTGRGIPPDKLHVIFNHGYTTKRGSHGFGLHTCANLMTEMGGSLHVRGMGLGVGAEFVIYLPLSKRSQTGEVGQNIRLAKMGRHQGHMTFND